MKIKLVNDPPYVFIECGNSSICAISPYNPNNNMNGLYVYKKVIGVDDV